MERSGDQRLNALFDIARELSVKKQADYGRPEEPFANVKASEEWGIAPWVGAMVRLNDKVRRLQAHAQGDTLQNENAYDSFLDIAVYALIACRLYDEVPELPLGVVMF